MVEVLRSRHLTRVGFKFALPFAAMCSVSHAHYPLQQERGMMEWEEIYFNFKKSLTIVGREASRLQFWTLTEVVLWMPVPWAMVVN